jgi:hypothetical protein
MILKKNILFFWLFLINQLMSLRFFYNFTYTKFNPEFFFVLYLILSLIFFIFILKLKIIQTIIDNKKLFYLCLILFTTYIFYKYPLSVGTERDDCYKIILNNLSNFNYPYNKTDLGDPCSTGLSTLLFYFPVFFFDNYFSFTCTFSFLIIYFFLKEYFNPSILVFFIYLQLFNLLYLEEAIAGSDFFLISVSYLIGIIFINNFFMNKDNKSLIISFLFLYFFYGSRIPFIFLLPFNFLIFYYVYKNTTVIKYFLILFSLSLITIIVPAIINFDSFHPFHIIVKGYELLGFNLIFSIFLIFFFIFLFNLIFQKKSKKLHNLIKEHNIIINLSIFVLPLLIALIVSFIDRLLSSQLKYWEGLSYIILIYPSLIFILSYRFYKK